MNLIFAFKVFRVWGFRSYGQKCRVSDPWQAILIPWAPLGIKSTYDVSDLGFGNLPIIQCDDDIVKFGQIAIVVPFYHELKVERQIESFAFKTTLWGWFIAVLLGMVYYWGWFTFTCTIFSLSISEIFGDGLLFGLTTWYLLVNQPWDQLEITFISVRNQAWNQ